MKKNKWKGRASDVNAEQQAREQREADMLEFEKKMRI